MTNRSKSRFVLICNISFVRLQKSLYVIAKCDFGGFIAVKILHNLLV